MVELTAGCAKECSYPQTYTLHLHVIMSRRTTVAVCFSEHIYHIPLIRKRETINPRTAEKTYN